MANEQEVYESSLAAGQIAKVKIYQGLVKKAASGHELNASELKEFRKLENEISSHLNGKAQQGPGIFKTLQEAADYAGVTKRTISYHINKSKKIALEPDGTIKQETVDAWLKAGGGKHKKKIITTHEKTEKANYRYRVAKAEREELIVDQLRKKLIPVDDVERAFENRAYELARSLLVLSRRIGHKVAAKGSQDYKAVVAIIDKEVHRLMDAYSRGLDY